MKVLMIDDHPLILAAMQNVVRGLGEGVRVVGAETVDEARNLLFGSHGFDLVLLDLFLGAHDGYDFLVELRAAHPQLPVVVVSASEDPADLDRCIDGGAMGFVPKRATNEMLFEALLLVMSGGVFVPEMFSGAGGLGPTMVAWPVGQDPAVDGRTAQAGVSGAALDVDPPVVARTLRASPSQPLLDAGLPMAPTPVDRVAAREALISPTSLESLGLTPRQSEVLALLLEGKPNKLIAREMGLSVETIKDHVAAVLRCLGVSSRTQAVIAVRHQFSPQASGVTATPVAASH
ncbi:response regulator transcription factor [Sphaerotilus mobilis]|uniref:LuxR family two component transcriptional regulator n=1 Tax=Sphaerotilus mobilis TaxID=47994 RepID=A0A4Q7LTN9_9BURK|nr:response regulator transcription factor [Sphaerotilus mobilis]RZS58094.1 LuxR family two component transcriptional regulator [Sphaerotilus mobilis]